MEVFQRQSETFLEFSSRYNHADVLVAGGFFAWKHVPRTHDLKKQIRTARNEGRLFPAYRDLSSFCLYLQKSSSNSYTQFVTLVEKGKEQPALVDFTLDQPPITWDQQIKNRPLLSKIQGPILPNFFETSPIPNVTQKSAFGL